jgi:hypothetical protein
MRASHKAVQRVSCKRCGMPKGQGCRTLTSGKAAEVHSVRYYDAGIRGQCWFTNETKELSAQGVTP